MLFLLFDLFYILIFMVIGVIVINTVIDYFYFLLFCVDDVVMSWVGWCVCVVEIPYKSVLVDFQFIIHPEIR